MNNPFTIGAMLEAGYGTMDKSAARPVYFGGAVPNTCDLCHRSINTVFIDGATTYGPWANMCPHCYGIFGKGLGMGYGQQYEKQSDGQWLKTGG